MKRQSTLLLIFLCLIGFIFSLSNQFIGDDHFLFENNTFYSSLNNLKVLLTSDAILKFSDTAIENIGQKFSSGTMSYRPVSLVTFFIDVALWKDNPAGFHLTNLLWHVLVSLLVYVLVWLLVKREPVAFFAAALFAVHPVHAEAVNAIGFRYDLIASVFFLSTLITYILFQNSKRKKSPPVRSYFKPGLWLTGSYILFFLGMFSKELCSTLPIIIILYDILKEKDKPPLQILKTRGPLYAGYFLILIFYWALYLWVMKNTVSTAIFSFDPRYYPPLLSEMGILFQYLLALIIPLTVGVAAPLYHPADASVAWYEPLAVAVAFVFALIFIIKNFRRRRWETFGLLWLGLVFLSTSNIIPLINPIAFRYLYLPTVGFCLLVAFAINRRKLIPIKKALKAVILFVCLITTIFQSRLYRDDQTYLRAMLKRQPDAYSAHPEMGKHYLKNGQNEKAARHLQQALDFPNRSPFHKKPGYYLFYLMGQSAEEEAEALKYFQRAIEENPDYIFPYIALARIYLKQGDYLNRCTWPGRSWKKNLRKDPARWRVFTRYTI